MKKIINKILIVLLVLAVCLVDNDNIIGITAIVILIISGIILIVLNKHLIK